MVSMVVYLSVTNPDIPCSLRKVYYNQIYGLPSNSISTINSIDIRRNVGRSNLRNDVANAILLLMGYKVGYYAVLKSFTIEQQVLNDRQPKQ